MMVTEPSPLVPDFVMGTFEPGFWQKLTCKWWIVPKRRLLRIFGIYGDTLYLQMWNGEDHILVRGEFTSKFLVNPRDADLRTITITASDGRKVRIYEMPPMFPNGSEDFEALLHILGAEETKASKISGFLNDLWEIAKAVLGK